MPLDHGQVNIHDMSIKDRQSQIATSRIAVNDATRRLSIFYDVPVSRCSRMHGYRAKCRWIH